MNQKKSSTLIRNVLKEFWNYLQIAWTLITKKTTHEAFITLQNKSQNQNMIDQKSKKSRIENSRIVLVYVTRNICSKTVII